MKGKSLLAVHDLSREEVFRVFDLARQLKTGLRAGWRPPLLRGKVLAMIFLKPSTRTRVSFETAMLHLGGHALYLDANGLQWSRGETPADTARTLSCYVDGIMARTSAHQDVVDLARFASVPVINGLTDYNHPCQAFADFLTILERRGTFEGLTFAWVGDGNNVCHSLLSMAAQVGAEIRVATPPGFEPRPAAVERAAAIAKTTGGKIVLTSDPRQAVHGAHAVYTDVWASMGQEQEKAARAEKFKGYQVDENLMKLAHPEAMFLHCLPAHRGEEVSPAVIDGPQSAVWPQAENRLHVQKAILALLMAD
jgi:ornithine carbamoyltransferase